MRRLCESKDAARDRLESACLSVVPAGANDQDPTPARNGSGSIYYRGHYNIISQLDNMVATKGLSKYKEIVLSGCSAGGMACYLKCDFVSEYFAKHNIPGVATPQHSLKPAKRVHRHPYAPNALHLMLCPGRLCAVSKVHLRRRFVFGRRYGHRRRQRHADPLPRHRNRDGV